jgi:peptidyl-prolyl cis-trans isomerase SurA
VRKLRNIVFVLLTLSASVCSAQTLPQREIVDKIVAIVGDTVILVTELEMQVQLYVLQSRQKPASEAQLKEIQRSILNDMINEQLFIAAAKEDTLIQIRDEEVEAAIDEQVARISKNFATNEEFLAALSAENLTLRDLRKRFTDPTKNQLLKQRAMQRRVYSVSVSKREVETYFQSFKDSLPSQPEAARLARIVLIIRPSQKVEDSVKAEATALRDKALQGADFAALSSHYSMPGVRENGGDLGFVSREDVVPEFSRAAFLLEPGGISTVVRTQFGYHIIKCEEKRGEQLRLRHILLPISPTQDDTARVMRLGDSLVTLTKNGADFAELAKAFSDDNESRAQGGEIGWVAVPELPADMQEHVKGWVTVNEVRGPILTSNSVQILKLLEQSPEKIFTLEADFDRIKEFARKDKAGHQVDQWITELRKQTYVETRLDDAN